MVETADFTPYLVVQRTVVVVGDAIVSVGVSFGDTVLPRRCAGTHGYQQQKGCK